MEKTRLGRFATDMFWAARGLVHGFRGESITLRAGNLTFISITSLLPLITVVLALLSSFKQAHGMVLTFLQDVLTPGAHRDTSNFVRQFFNDASSGTAGGLSFVALLFSAGILLRHLDASLNEIFAVQRKRAIWVSVALYTGTLLIGPLVSALVLFTTGGMKKLVIGYHFPFASELIFLGGIIAAVSLGSLLYKFAPHAPVRWRSAFAGALFAGVGWEIARHLYGGIARLFFSANPVFGSLGIAPLFLMWMYLSWCLVLFGARLAYAVEHAAFRGVFMDLLHHPRARELVAARIAQVTARAFLEGGLPPTHSEVAQRLNVPGQLVKELVSQLEGANLLSVGKKGELRPARDPKTLTLADVSAAVGGTATLVRAQGQERREEFAEFEKLFGALDDANVRKLSGISWEQLSQQAPGR